MSTPLDRSLVERIYLVVEQVPSGMVATYGDIAAIVGGCNARDVGYALNEVPKNRAVAVPWQRIINASGGISTRGPQQHDLLEAEGIVFDLRGRVDLARCRWPGPTAEWALDHDYHTLAPAEPAPEEQQGQMRLF